MANLQFVDFALMAGLLRKEMQFGLPDDFSNIDATILPWTSHPTSAFPSVFTQLFSNPQNVLHSER